MKTDIAMFLGLVFALYYCLVPSSRYDPRLGNASIWQDPSERKGTWQKTFVAVWDATRNGYITAVFDGSLDYGSRNNMVYSADEVFAQLDVVRKAFEPTCPRAFEYRYTAEEVVQYAESYGF
jgi:hypothetical protein